MHHEDESVKERQLRIMADLLVSEAEFCLAKYDHEHIEGLAHLDKDVTEANFHLALRNLEFSEAEYEKEFGHKAKLLHKDGYDEISEIFEKIHS